MAEKLTFTPGDMAEPLKDQEPLSAIEHAGAKDVGPRDGEIIEVDGEKYRFQMVPTGQRVWDRESRELAPGYHTLKTWFSHSTDGIGAGPGWDGRHNLSTLTSDEMTHRYGHVFTPDEITAPGGKWEDVVSEDGWGMERTLVGGMPSDIPYYELTPFDEGPFDKSK